MKPRYLELCGINSFSEPAVINFEQLLEYGLFGIFGDTGSGKSTVLDCIGFALYGDIARSRSGSIADVIHYKADKAYVIFEFEIVNEGRRRVLRVERELKRKNAAQNLHVYERTETGLAALADGVREGNNLLKEIIGLEQRDFEKCIALPQGEFAQFVKAQRGERLKLVSHLFGLERYGEALSKRVNARHSEAKSIKIAAESELKPYEGYTKEHIKGLESGIAAHEKQLAEAKAEAVKAEAEYARLAKLRESFLEREKLERKQQELAGHEGEFAQLEQELSRLDRAKSVLRASEEHAAAEESLSKAERALQGAQAELAQANKESARAAAYDRERTAAELEALVAQEAEIKNAQKNARQRKSLQERLDRARQEYLEEKKQFPDFDYERERAVIEEKLAALGEGDFLTFAEEHGKAMLLHAEYAQFAEELSALTQKYPVIQSDSAPLIQKYHALSSGEKTDFSKLRLQYEARENARKELNDSLRMLERQKGNFNTHREKLGNLMQKGKELADQLKELGEEVPLTITPEEMARRIAEKRAEKSNGEAALAAAQDRLSRAQVALAAAETQKKSAEEALTGAKSRLQTALFGVFESEADAKALLEKYGEPDAAHSRLKQYKDERAFCKTRLAELGEVAEVTQEALEACERARQQSKSQVSELESTLAVERQELARSKTEYAKKRELEQALEDAKRQEALFERLKKLIEGNKFMEYVAEEYLQTVAVNASARLLTLTDGRYFLRYEKGFFVGDNFNGGTLRAVYTLSGGETFLVSLSLALALSAEICARSLRPVEFFFLDEGFGTLDEKLVDTVMDSLEKLRGEHFSIGIISHVEELKHRIGRRLIVTKATERHGSQIRME